MKPQVVRPDPAAQDLLNAHAFQGGQLRIMPASFYRDFPQEQIACFCHTHGLYALPTFELVNLIESLMLEVKAERAIEIGSGNGALGLALNIPCTDNKMQNADAVSALYALMGQPPVKYGDHVIELDAARAVNFFQPQVVVAAWVTHIYNPAEHERGGNMFGVDELALFRKIRRYIFVGHDSPHQHKPLRLIPHQVIRADYIFSRSLDRGGNAVWVWDNDDYGVSGLLAQSE